LRSCENGYCSIGFKFPYIISVIKLRILEWLGLCVRMFGERTVKKLLEGKQGGRRKNVRYRLRCLDVVELNLRNVGVKVVRTSVLDRIE